ncbi:trypsin-like serine protease [Demequina sp. NBRC 110056]|uniref:trypsin-like serine protease n=1 Tax=Demequina sp. NBRC 110056 TaxID=1570345 RepID=UPI00135646F5|nr:trypsin-like serine protease [Demequina sp. NBRC 110056]
MGIALAALFGTGLAPAGEGEYRLPDLDELDLPRGDITFDPASMYTAIESNLFFVEPELWGGAYVEGRTLYVNAVGISTQEATRRINDLGFTTGFEVLETSTSLADFDRATTAIAEDMATSGTVGSVGPDYSQERLVVGLDGAESTGAIDDAIDRFSGATIGLGESGIDVAYYDGGRPETTASRYYDTSPYKGGAAVEFTRPGHASPAQPCTTAFSWSKGSSQYLVTAAHCTMSTSGDSYANARRIASNQSVHYHGAVTWRSGGALGTYSGLHGDVAVVKVNSGSTSARVYVGTYNTDLSRIVRAPSSIPQGMHLSTLRTSGAGPRIGNGDGEIDPDWISLVNQTVTYTSGRTYKSLTFAEHNAQCVRQGDSGGAFYTQRSDGAANAIGVTSGTNNGGSGATNCRNYYTPISYVAQDFGGALRTG